ncbi:MAG TPA: thioesterase family protein [Motilibacteraceae bacterium]|nr:thioesterase family protein [Motilibacteraceae bacterium]
MNDVPVTGERAARFTFRCPMRWSDMDAYGHVNNTRFLTYLEEARIEMFQELAERARGEDGLLSTGVLVARHEIRYLRPLVHRTEPVPIDVWVTKIGGASFDVGYEVHDDEGAVVYARAASTMVPYDFVNERPRRLRPHEREFLQRHLDPTDPMARKAR